MRFPGFTKFSLESIRDRMIRQHSRWLSRMLRRRQAPVRIPLRRVSDGGYSRLMASEDGRQIAAQWWEAALQKLD